VKSEEKDSFRMTTVIKSPEGRFWSKLNDVLHGRQFWIKTNSNIWPVNVADLTVCKRPGTIATE
jgi:hypothetical protein